MNFFVFLSTLHQNIKQRLQVHISPRNNFFTKSNVSERPLKQLCDFPGPWRMIGFCNEQPTPIGCVNEITSEHVHDWSKAANFYFYLLAMLSESCFNKSQVSYFIKPMNLYLVLFVIYSLWNKRRMDLYYFIYIKTFV